MLIFEHAMLDRDSDTLAPDLKNGLNKHMCHCLVRTPHSIRVKFSVSIRQRFSLEG